ncbi:MAG: prolipoprotein diacylglyceryl transferase [Sarcina sp.]
MKPVLFNLGGFNIYGYGFLIAIGIICAVFLLNRNAKKRGYNEDHIFNLVIITILMGILGGKVLYIITDFKSVMQDPLSIFKEFGYGFVIYGAIIFGILGVFLYCKYKKWNSLEVFDMVVPGLALAQGFGRIGCFLAGCCYGGVTDGPLYLVFPSGGLAPAGVHLHPTQIYCAIFDFLLAAFLMWYSKHREKNAGDTLCMYMIIYSIGRFLVEFLRNDPRGSVGALSTSQFISIFMLIAGVIIYNRHRFKGRYRKSEY